MPDEPHFAPRDETAMREELIEEFVAEVLRLPWAFVTDASTLSDFEGVRTELELSDACEAVYGMTLEKRHLEVPLWQLVDELNGNRKK